MSSTVSCSSAAARVVGVMPSSARIVVTASGWVMYGSPLLRICPRWARSATSYARSIRPRSALGWVLRTVCRIGSRTGLLATRGPPKRASRARMRRGVVGSDVPDVGSTCASSLMSGF